MKVKYIRWSTLSQTGARQLVDADNYDKILQEQVSGSIPLAKRPRGAELLKLIKNGQVTDLFVEELSRLGRNTLDTLSTLNLCEKHNVNVHIQNMNICSRVNGKADHIFKLITHVVAAIGEQEKELIKERTESGKLAARNRGIVFGRKIGTHERKSDFLEKPKNRKILKKLQENNDTIREIAKMTNSSTVTVMKVKKIAIELRKFDISN